MNYFECKIGSNGAYAKYYFQEPHHEIDADRVYPTIIICPGGAYLWTSFREDESVALRFLSEGFHVVVVHYATEGIEAYKSDHLTELPQNPVSVFPNPLIELAKAIVYLREHAVKHHVDTDYIVVAGFSAGGNLAGQLATLWQKDWLEEKVGKSRELYRPTHALLCYAAFDFKTTNPIDYKKGNVDKISLASTGNPFGDGMVLEAMNPINHVSQFTPPCFIWHTREDQLVSSKDALQFALKLEQYKINYEIHVFDKGKHGLVLGDLRTGIKASNENAQVYKWVDLFLEWLSPIKTHRASFYEAKEN